MERNLSKVVRTYYRDVYDRIALLPLEDSVLVCCEISRVFNMLCALYPSDVDVLGSYGSSLWDAVYSNCDSAVGSLKKEIETADAGLYT